MGSLSMCSHAYRYVSDCCMFYKASQSYGEPKDAGKEQHVDVCSCLSTSCGGPVGDESLPRLRGVTRLMMCSLVSPSSIDRRSAELIVFPKKVVGCRGGSRYFEGVWFFGNLGDSKNGLSENVELARKMFMFWDIKS